MDNDFDAVARLALRRKIEAQAPQFSAWRKKHITCPVFKSIGIQRSTISKVVHPGQCTAGTQNGAKWFR